MKKISSLLLFCFFASIATAQNTIGISAVYIPANISTYNTKIEGTSQGIQLDYRIDVSDKANLPAVTELGLKQIILKTSFVNMSPLTLGAYNNIFGKDVNLVVAGAYGESLSDRTKLFITPELGLRYSSKDFYNTGNENVIIGSHLNIVIGLGANMQINLLKNFGIQFGAEVTHASNMRTQQPNLGMNQFELTAGLFSSFGDNELYEQGNMNAFRYNKLKRFEIDLLYGYSGQVKTGYYINPKTGKGMYPDTASYQGKTGVMPDAILSASYNFSDVRSVAFKVGTDFIYRFKTLNYDHFFQTYQGRYSSYNNLNAGIFAGLGIQVGRFNFSGSEGYLLFTNEISGGKRLYSALELKMALTQNIGIELRSQLNDFGAVGLAFNF